MSYELKRRDDQKKAYRGDCAGNAQTVQNQDDFGRRKYRIDTPNPPLQSHRDEWNNLKAGEYSMGELGVLEIEAQQVGADTAANTLSYLAENGRTYKWPLSEKMEAAAQAILKLREETAVAHKYVAEMLEVDKLNKKANGTLTQENKKLTKELDAMHSYVQKVEEERHEARKEVAILTDEKRLRFYDVLHGRTGRPAQERQEERGENSAPGFWGGHTRGNAQGTISKQGPSVPQADGNPYLPEMAQGGDGEITWKVDEDSPTGYSGTPGRGADEARESEGGTTPTLKEERTGFNRPVPPGSNTYAAVCKTPKLSEQVEELESIAKKHSKWLNEAATAAGGCDLDQVVNVIRKLKNNRKLLLGRRKRKFILNRNSPSNLKNETAGAILLFTLGLLWILP